MVALAAAIEGTPWADAKIVLSVNASRPLRRRTTAMGVLLSRDSTSLHRSGVHQSIAAATPARVASAVSRTHETKLNFLRLFRTFPEPARLHPIDRRRLSVPAAPDKNSRPQQGLNTSRITARRSALEPSRPHPYGDPPTFDSLRTVSTRIDLPLIMRPV